MIVGTCGTLRNVVACISLLVGVKHLRAELAVTPGAAV